MRNKYKLSLMKSENKYNSNSQEIKTKWMERWSLTWQRQGKGKYSRNPEWRRKWRYQVWWELPRGPITQSRWGQGEGGRRHNTHDEDETRITTLKDREASIARKRKRVHYVGVCDRSFKKRCYFHNKALKSEWNTIHKKSSWKLNI